SGRIYDPRRFLRKVSKQLLKQFFDRRNRLAEVLWYLQGDTEVEKIYTAWQALPDGEQVPIDQTFRTIDGMACEAGIKALVEEGRFQGVDLAAEIAKCSVLHDKAMWAYLFHERVFYVASIINYAESLTGRYWVRRMDLPRKPLQVSKDSCAALARA